MSRGKFINDLKKQKNPIEPGQEVLVDLFKPEDALGVSLAYYDIYGDSFPIDHVYDPQAVARRNETDDQHTVIARTPKGEVVGLAGLFRHAPNPDIYEAGQLMVLKSYRNSPVSGKIVSKTLCDLPEQLGLEIVFSETVCNHGVSQKLAYTRGLRPTGFGLECMPAKAYEGEGRVQRNVSLLLMFLVNRDRPHRVYLPAPYEEVISGLYHTLGLDRARGEHSDLSGETIAQEFILPENDFARLSLEKLGADFLDAVVDIEEKTEGNGVVQVVVNMGDAAAPKAVALLRQRGYFLGALLPLWFGRDGIMMQKLPQSPLWEGIEVVHGKSRQLLDALRRDYNTLIGQ